MSDSDNVSGANQELAKVIHLTERIQKNDKALIVDDNQASREIIEYFLGAFNYEVHHAENGSLALETLTNKNFDLIVLDWKMPKLPGKETLLLGDQILADHKKKLASPEDFRKTKVIIYSSTSLEELALPTPKFFQIIGYISKSWYLDTQKKRFRDLLKKEMKPTAVAS